MRKINPSLEKSQHEAVYCRRNPHGRYIYAVNTGECLLSAYNYGRHVLSALPC